MMIIKKIILSTKHQLIILLLIAVGLNINTLSNEYAMDDVIVLTGNTLVQKGIKGIPQLLTTEYFYGSENRNSELSGGRYRPFALVIFALEYQIFGMTPWVNHLINILLFALLIALLFKLLQKHVFHEQHEYLAFATCLLFVVHPIHTEVIANIKSRDELITFILLIATSFTFIKYSQKKSIGVLLLGLLCFFLALLTRESAVPFIGIVPLVAYFFFNQTLKKSILLSVPLLAVFVIYMALRISMVGFSFQSHLDIQDAPFLYASATQAFATKVFILFKYVWLMVFPHPLSCDYGYNQIPYIDIATLPFILSSLLFLGLIAYAVFTFNKRSIFSFSILFFLSTIFLFANFIVDIGAPLAERLLFQPSLAFCIAVAALYININEKSKLLANASLLVILLLFSTKTFLRNAEWKNNQTLYLSDVNSSPNSIRTNSAAADIYLSKAYPETNIELKKDYFKKTIYYAERSLKMYPANQRITDYLAAAYSGLIDLYNTIDLFYKDNNFNPSNPEVKKIIEGLSADFYRQGNGFYEQNNFDAAIQNYLKCLKLSNNHVEALYNLGGNYFLKNDTAAAIQAWEKVKRLDPDHKFKVEEFSK